MPKVLIINGSPRIKGNTSIALDEMVRVFEKEGVDWKQRYTRLHSLRILL